MRVLLLFLILTVPMDIAQAVDFIHITTASKYDNGEPLNIDDISHHDICTLNDRTAVECIAETSVGINGFKAEILPEGTKAIKARTVDKFGVVGDYGNVFYKPFRKPLPPDLFIKIKIQVDVDA